MQQRGLNITMEKENLDETNISASRGRHNSKLKVLVRSHAMREEQSPPREPSPNLLVVSPCIKLTPSSMDTPSSTTSMNPVVVLSPSISCENSPNCQSPLCVSPTSTMVPSPNSHQTSPLQCASPTLLLDADEVFLEKELKKEVIASHLNNNNSNLNNNINNKKKLICDCSTQQNCAKCVNNNNLNNNKTQERINNNNNLTNNNNNVSSNTLTVNRVITTSKGKLRQQSSSQGSCDGGSTLSNNSPCLSRDSSSEQYTDTSGIDLELFIPETLNRNPKDRAFMLRIEQELVSLAKDTFRTHFKFPPMSSYQRMLVHRCAAYFGMDHNIESSGKCVVVNKTKNTRIPEIEFKQHIKDDIVFTDEQPKRSILKRDSNSMDDYNNFKLGDHHHHHHYNSMENRRSKSFEEREEEYEKVRRRIFNREKLCLLRQMHDGSNDDFEWAEIPWTSTESESARFRLQLPDQRRHMGKLIKVQSEETGETSRPYVAKSYSFGGYGGILNRGDSMVSTHSAGPRLLSKQDSTASSVSWRLSPSSSGYKSQSQMSESVTPSPTSTPHPLPSTTSNNDESVNNSDKNTSDTNSIVWAVTDMQSVPKGSIIINPQTGEPIKNDDGSLYHYDPNNPPPGFTPTKPPPPSPKKQQISTQKYNVKEESPVKKHSTKYSPSRKFNVTNSATSPSLPYTSPPPSLPLQAPPPVLAQEPNRNFHYVPNENIPQQPYPVYGPTYPSPGQEVYQQPCIVYTTPYGVPVSPGFDGRMEAPPQITEMGGTYYVNVPENTATPAAAAQLTYQQSPPYWNPQTITYYQNPAAPQNPALTQRFPSLPPPLPPPPAIHPAQNPNYLPSTYPQNYITAPQQAVPQQQQQNADLVPLYPAHQHQLIYSSSNLQNPLIYPNQPNIIYTAQNPIYSSPIYPPYPQNTSTPNGAFPGVVQQPEQNHQNILQLTQNLAQMNLNPAQLPQNYHMNNKVMPVSHFDRQKSTCNTPKGNKFSNPKSFIGSSQSSTGTNSPATTVVANTGYCGPIQNATNGTNMLCNNRTPPSDTPPNQFSYGTNFGVPPMLFRQMSNVRANTPGTNRNSRSPTPASDIPHFDRQRIPIPPTLYHGMPYVLQPDTRLMPARNQTVGAYRQPPPPLRPQPFPGSDNRSHRPKKSKGNKLTDLPANGKPL